jgi:hypothetical protein
LVLRRRAPLGAETTPAIHLEVRDLIGVSRRGPAHVPAQATITRPWCRSMLLHWALQAALWTNGLWKTRWPTDSPPPRRLSAIWRPCRLGPRGWLVTERRMAEFSWNMDPSLTDVCGLEDWVPACAVHSRSRGAMSLIPSLAVDRVGNKSQDNVPRGQRQKRYATYCFAQPRCPMLRWRFYWRTQLVVFRPGGTRPWRRGLAGRPPRRPANTLRIRWSGQLQTRILTIHGFVSNPATCHGAWKRMRGSCGGDRRLSRALGEVPQRRLCPVFFGSRVVYGP